MGMVSDVAEALRRGAADYLIKPLVDFDVLLHSINKALEVLDLQRQNTLYRLQLEVANRELQESVRVLERDQLAGRQVQSNLLPKTPLKLGHTLVSHKIIPSLFLSGDFVDYGLIDGRFLSFYLMDVSGHGAAPAFVAVWLKQLVRRMVREQRHAHRSKGDKSTVFEMDVSEWTRVVNKELLLSKFGCHLTCIVGILDLVTRQIRYVLGGHLPLPVVVGEGKAWFLDGKGKPLGIFPNAQWQVNEAILPENHSLIVFSDGVLEILPPKDLIEKEQHLLELLKDTNGDLESVCSSLNLDKLSGSPDDIAVLTLNLGRSE
jgi:serine phosphatase RsbU (regulator of sigma subunit)